MGSEGQNSLATFKASLSGSVPPEGHTGPLHALWWVAKGAWDKAHVLVQEDHSREAAWVHAHLHRVEGDLANAAYWYGQAGKSEARGPLDAEWDGIAAALLDPAD